jgi:hypothetical protein
MNAQDSDYKEAARSRWPSAVTRNRVLFFLVVLLLAGSVRLLTFNFLRNRLDDPAWFQRGTYAAFEERAVAVIGGTEAIFWVSDPSRTDVIFFPPGYPLMIVAIFRLTGQHSIYAVQAVQTVIDLLVSLVFITGLAVTAFGLRAGMWASVMTAFSPLLAFVGVSPFSDAPTAWLVIGGIWLLVLALKKGNVRLAFAAGVVLGCACWLRLNPLYLSVFLALALLAFAGTAIQKRLRLSAALLLGTLLLVSPIVIRNVVVFREFTVGAGIGVNLWEGLGETELGRANGFEFGDSKVVERDRADMRLPADFPMTNIWPDGINRDRARRKEALNFIRQHPVWYAGVMLKRMWGMLKVAGAPLPYYGTAGINVTSARCLPASWQKGIIAGGVNALGMIQSVTRYALLPLALVGLGLAARRDWPVTRLFLAAIVYYLGPGTFVHPEIRYALPMHWLLPIFAGLSLSLIDAKLRERWISSRASQSPL